MAATVFNVTAAETKVISAVPQEVKGVVFTPTAAGNSLILYDNATEASGTILVELLCSAATSIVFNPTTPLWAKNGITAIQTGASSAGQVYV